MRGNAFPSRLRRFTPCGVIRLVLTRLTLRAVGRPILSKRKIVVVKHSSTLTQRLLSSWQDIRTTGG